MKEKTFYKILMEFTFSIEKTKRRLSDLRLTSIEKLIIEGHLNIRKNLNQEVLDSLASSVPSELPFVESQRLLLLGSAMNNMSKFREAEKLVLDSLEMLKRVEAPFFLFYSYHMLFTIYDNLHQPALMKKMIGNMEGLTKSKRQEVQFLICQFCYEQQLLNIERAEKLLGDIDLRMGELTEGDIVRQLVNKFTFFAQLEKLNQARDVLNELKQYRNYQLTENYNYMKKLLDHLIDGDPLYIYDHQFENVPVLLHQVKVIQSLEENNEDQARFHWAKLNAISPTTYAEAFHFKGLTCLFSLALNKHCSHETKADLVLKPIGDNKVDQLYSILNHSKQPLHASLIHELIWGNPPSEKEDLKKVSRLISRLKNLKNVSVDFRKGTYTLVKDKISKVS